MTNLSKSGCKKKTDKEALQVILTACTNQLEPKNKNIVHNAIGMSKKTFYGSKKVVLNTDRPTEPVYDHNIRVRKASVRAKVQRACVTERL